MQVGAVFRHWSLRLFKPDRILQQTYEAFKMLLSFDSRGHELMAEFEELYHEGKREDIARIRSRYRQMAEAVAGMVAALEQMHPGQAGSLHDYFKKYDFYVRLQLAPPEQFLIPPFVVGHDGSADCALIGHKSANLLLLKQADKGRVPAGFTITATTYAFLVEHNHLRPALDLLLAAIDPESVAELEVISQALVTLVRRMVIPEQIAQAVLTQYDRMADLHTEGLPRVAVRSSALHEDGPYSFAGQYHSVLGVGRDELLAAYLEVLASKYTPQALLYRIYAGISDEEAAMAVLVLEMIDAVASGVVYTRNPAGIENGDALLIHGVHGLGLPLVSGETVPDSFVFSAQSAIPSQIAGGSQHHQLVVRQNRLQELPLSLTEAPSLSLTQAQAMQLAALARELETFFGGPQDIEWALGSDRELYILQSRPLKIEAGPLPMTAVALPEGQPLLVGAKRASGGIGCGVVHHLDPMGTAIVPRGAVLVTRHIPPSLVRFIDRLEAVICEQGSVTGHFATVCREFGVALLVDAAGALDLLPAGLEVTVDGGNGAVYPGRVEALLAYKTAAKTKVATAFSRKLRSLLDYITPLNLVDPTAATFRPQFCRSLHDIIRYAHEKAVQTMFGLGDIASGSSSRCRKLATSLPLDIYLLDVGGAFADAGAGEAPIGMEHLKAPPFLAVWKGLSHPEIDWQTHLSFDWKGFGDMALSGGVASGGSKNFASYAILSPDYLNLTMRFGFHFTLVDCLCGADARANYCQVRFAGGGGDYQGRSLRITLIDGIFRRLGFEVNIRGDLLDARVSGYPSDQLCALLAEVGRLSGMTKLLDMELQAEDIEHYTEQFFIGAGRFAGHSDLFDDAAK